MNDEASSHWTATLLQMIEGHQWLQYNLNYTPSSSWSIDPFGVSATQTSLLNNMGFENLVVNRIHYVLKRHFAEHQQLEFRWKQAWGKITPAVAPYILCLHNYICFTSNLGDFF